MYAWPVRRSTQGLQSRWALWVNFVINFVKYTTKILLGTEGHFADLRFSVRKVQVSLPPVSRTTCRDWSADVMYSRHRSKTGSVWKKAHDLGIQKNGKTGAFSLTVMREKGFIKEMLRIYPGWYSPSFLSLFFSPVNHGALGFSVFLFYYCCFCVCLCCCVFVVVVFFVVLVVDVFLPVVCFSLRLFLCPLGHKRLMEARAYESFSETSGASCRLGMLGQFPLKVDSTSVVSSILQETVSWSIKFLVRMHKSKERYDIKRASDKPMVDEDRWTIYKTSQD